MLLDAALDLFLGSACAACGRPGRALCPVCEEGLPVGGRISMPSPTPDGLAVTMSAGEYDGALKAMVNAHKEHRRLALARPLGSLLAGVVAQLVPPGPVLLVPVPSSRPVVRRRGHDPLLRVSRVAAGRLRSQGRRARVARLLYAVHRPEDQAGLAAEQRLANLQGAMRGRPWSGPEHLVVVDDVVTTGATCREAQRALEASGASVVGIAAIAATRRRHLRASLPIHSKGD